jgi:chemotaxis protein methyltransferase CheR
LVVSETARALVRFENRNLASGDPELWQAQTFDVVFCRNVIMYFSPDQARILLDRIARSLRPGGYLFLGHAETLRSLSDKFMLRQSHDTFYYQLNDDAPSVISSHPLPGIAFAPLVATAGPTLPGNEWMAAIRDADERIAALAAAKQAAARRAAPVVGRWDLAAAFDLLRDERFAEALALIARLPPAAAADPDVLLLRAAILAMGGQRVAAEETCRQLLAISEGNAGAHHILALCHDAVGETASATEHSRIAVRLDGSFAMPRLHLGLLTRRSGDRDAARRELGRALILLRREEPLRLLMFGGGFGRAGLISLCAAALRDCGGSP